MSSYEYLPHTADIKFKAYGATLDEAFSNAAYAFTDIMIDHEKVDDAMEKSFSVQSENLDALLYDFLEQFIFFLETEGFLLHAIASMQINGTSLSITCRGDDHLEKYEIKTHIKAVTYQQMEIREKEKYWSVQVIVDV